MATRKPSSRRAKDAASDFVKRVMKGTWEDRRDLSSVNTQTKSKSKTPNASPAKVLISRSPGKVLATGSSAKTQTGGNPSKLFTVVNTAKILPSGSPVSPAKVWTSGNTAKVVAEDGTTRVLTVGGHCKLLTSGSPVKILTSGNQSKLLTCAKPLKLQAKKSPTKPGSSEVRSAAKTGDGKWQASDSSDCMDFPPSPASTSCTSGSRNCEIDGDVDEPSSALSVVSSSPSIELGTKSSSSGSDIVENRERSKVPTLLTLENCVRAKVVVEDICKKQVSKPVVLPVASKRPRGRPRKEPAADSKKLKSASEHPAWLLAGKNKPGRKPKSRVAELSQPSKHVTMVTSLMDDRSVLIKTEIKEEQPDDDSIPSNGQIPATGTNQASHLQANGTQIDVNISNKNAMAQIKDEPTDDISEKLSDSIKTEDVSGESTPADSQSGSISYPSEQGHFLNIFGLIKKSDIKQESLKNKLHREVGGKLRRIIKPRMAPEMVYNKLTLAKGCVLEGESEDKTVLTKDTVKISQRSRPVHTEPLKLKSRPCTHIKITTEQFDLTDSLIHCDKVVTVPTIVCEDRMSNVELCSKKQWLKCPAKDSKMDTNEANGTEAVGAEPCEKLVKKEKSSTRLVPSSSSPSKISARKHPLNKSSSSGAPMVKEEDCAGRRRSSRHQGSQRKQWWHLLRAAPDEFEEDKAWDEEQDRLEKRRKMLKEKREKELLGQLQAKDPETREPSSSQESSGSDSRSTKRPTADADQLESKKKPRKSSQSTNKQDEPQSETDVTFKSSGHHEQAATDVKDGMAPNTQLAASLKRKRKKKKILVEDNEESTNLPHHSDLVQQIQPLVKNLMEGGGKTDSMQLEMELKSDQPENYITPSVADGLKVTDESLMLPEVAICEGHQCTIPHMCSTCWINDHMYCLNMKRIARDLPPFGGCLHYSLCSHYPRRDIEHKQGYRCSKFTANESNTEPLLAGTKEGASSAKDSLQPVTESDLFCNEQLDDSDESSPGSPVPQGTEILKAQLKARAVQIAKSLGVPSAQAQVSSTEEMAEQAACSFDADHSDTSEAMEDNSNITINQHGAELILYNGQSYLPNHTFEDSVDTPAGWLKPFPSPKQSPTFAKSPKSVHDVDHKAKKLQIRLCPPENLDVPLNDISKPGATHKLVRVKVHRVGDNKILLKQMKDLGSSGSEEVLIREIELPVTSGGGKNDEMDIDWLSNILAEEAVKLASEGDKTVQTLDSLKGKKNTKRSPPPGIPASPIANSENDARPSPSPTDNASDDIPWTMETINDDGDDSAESSLEETSYCLDRDVTESEVDPKIDGTISVIAAPQCKTSDIAIKIHSPDEMSTHSKDSALTFSTKEIREEDPILLSRIKQEPGLLAALCKRLQDERDALKELIKESDSVLSAFDDDHDQKACLLAALQSEKNMLQDDIKLRRDTINKLAETTGNISKFCSCLEMSKEELEDCISSFTEILANLEKEGMLLSHPEETARLHSYNRRLQKVISAAVSEPAVKDDPAHIGPGSEPVSESVNGEILPVPGASSSAVEASKFSKPINSDSIFQTDTGELVVLSAISMDTGAQVTCSTSGGYSLTKSPQGSSVSKLQPIHVPLSTLSNVIAKDAKTPALSVTLTLDQLKKAGVLKDAVAKLVSNSKTSTVASLRNAQPSRVPLVLKSLQTLHGSSKQDTCQPVTVMAGASSNVKLVTSSGPAAQLSSVAGISKASAGGISLLGMSLLKKKSNKPAAAMKSQLAKSAATVDVQMTGSVSICQSSTETCVGPRVVTAAGVPTSLPYLSPSVLRAIGPNDQIVVLTADQFKQFQQFQEPPFGPVQIRIPVSKRGTTRLQPSQNKPSKLCRRVLMERRLTESRNEAVTPVGDLAHTYTDFDTVSLAECPMVEPLTGESNSHCLPAATITSIPISVTPTETLYAYSNEEKVTDLLQLAMENSQISPKALTDMARVNMDGETMVLKEEEGVSFKEGLSQSMAAVHVTPEQVILDHVLPLDAPIAEPEVTVAGRGPLQLEDIGNPEMYVGTSGALQSDVEQLSPAQNQILQSHLTEMPYELQCLKDTDNQYSDKQVVDVITPFGQSLQEVIQDEGLEYTMQADPGTEHVFGEQLAESDSHQEVVSQSDKIVVDSFGESFLKSFDNSAHVSVDQSADSHTEAGHEEDSQLVIETGGVLGDCTEQYILNANQQQGANGPSQQLEELDSACSNTQVPYQCVEVAEPMNISTQDASSDRTKDCGHVVIEMVIPDGSIVYHQGVPVLNMDSNQRRVTYRLIEPNQSEALVSHSDDCAGTAEAQHVFSETVSETHHETSSAVKYTIVEANSVSLQTVQHHETVGTSQLVDDQVQLPKTSVATEQATVGYVQSEMASSDPAANITYTIDDNSSDVFAMSGSLLNGCDAESVRELIITDTPVVQDQYYDVHQLTQHQDRELCLDGLNSCELQQDDQLLC